MEDPIRDEVLDVLQQIGASLDQRRPVRVVNEGIVVLDQAPENQEEKVQTNERQRPRRPAAGSRKRTARRKGTPQGSRTSGARSRVRSLRPGYELQIEDVQEAYPGATFHSDEHGIWLFAQSRILEGLAHLIHERGNSGLTGMA